MARPAKQKIQKSRRATRFPIMLPLQFRGIGEKRWSAGKTENISRTGVLFTAERVLEKDSEMQLTFQLASRFGAGQPGHAFCVGKVVRTVLPGSTDQPGAMAAAFRYSRLIPNKKMPVAEVTKQGVHPTSSTSEFAGNSRNGAER